MLPVEEISDHDDFFVMGGNSISAAHAAHKMGIDMRLIYAFPTPFKLLHGMLDQKNTHGLFSSYNPVPMKRTKLLDDTLPKSDALKVITKNDLLGGLLHAKNVKEIPELCRKKDMNQTTGHLEKSGSVFNIDPSTVRSSSSPASHGSALVCRDADIWISNLCLPLSYSLSRCNKSMTWGEAELNNDHYVRSLIKTPRCTKGCLQELWKVLLKSCVDASPLVVYKDGKINLFIGSHSHIFLCVDAVR